MSREDLDNRAAQIEAFIDAAGWGAAARVAVPGDASARRYMRLSMGQTRAILMDAPKMAESPSEPEGATPQQRRALGYNAQARLAGTRLDAFTAIANGLGMRGFSAPQILNADMEAGLLLLEDFGDGDYARILAASPAQEAPLYLAAAETLAAIYRASFGDKLSYQGYDWPLRDYDATALLAETDLCYDWFAKDYNYEISDDARAEIYGLFRESFKALDAHAAGLALRDFHAANLFWLPDRDGPARVGLIDFQDALLVHPSYDLMSLITDIRRDVSPALKDDLIAHFCAHAGIKDDADFRAAYAVMSVQRGTKLLGFPVRADLKFGKPQYRALLPRVKYHLNDDLSHPLVAPIKAWFARHMPDVLI